MEIFVVKIVWKYFLWSGVAMEIYHCKMLYMFRNIMLRKWRITQGISAFAAFMCIATSERRLKGKCLSVKETLMTGMLC